MDRNDSDFVALARIKFSNMLEAGCNESSKILRREYGRWYRMMSRCYNEADQAYKNYGGRGIAVCKRWHVFANFFLDMGPPPSDDLSMDRIDNDGSYELSNIRWATASLQMQNRRGLKARTRMPKGSICNVSGKWRALIRIKGMPSLCKTFAREDEARAWAAQQIGRIFSVTNG